MGLYHGANKGTLRYMEKHIDIWPCCNINKITKKLVINSDEIKSILLYSGEYELDTPLTVETFKSLLDKLSSASSNSFTLQEVITLIRYLSDADNIAEENYNESITVTQLVNLLDSFSDESVY